MSIDIYTFQQNGDVFSVKKDCYKTQSPKVTLST